MTARPLDYGDEFPGDSGDVAPTDPTAAFVERDFKVKSTASSGVKARPAIKAAPDLRKPKPNPENPRSGFSGIIVKRDSRNKYVIIRQDGKRGFAFTHGDDAIYEGLRVGEEVTMMEGQHPGYWHIIGRVRRNELESLRLLNDAQVTVRDVEKLITFKTKQEDTGDDISFKMLDDGTVKILTDITAEYEISLNAYVSTKGSTTDKKRITVLMDVRMNEETNFLEFKQTEIEVETLVPPAWIGKISLDSCGGY